MRDLPTRNDRGIISPDRRSRAAECLGSRRFLVFALVATVVLRVAFILIVPFQQVYDNALYLEFGTALSTGGGYTYKGNPTAFWSAGYPLTLASVFKVLGPSLAVAQAINIVAAAALTYIVSRLTTDLTGDCVAGGVAALLVCLFPNLVAASAVTMTEVVYLTVATAGAWLITCRSSVISAVPAGLLFGYGILIQSRAAGLLLCLYLAMVVSRHFQGRLAKETLRLAIALAACAVVVTPWIVRNSSAVGAPVLSTNGGVLFAMGHNPNADGAYMHPGVVADALGLPASDVDERTSSEVARESKFRSAALQWARRHPIEVVRLWPKKIWLSFRSGLGVVNWIRDGMRPAHQKPYLAFQIVVQCSYVAVWVLAVAGLIASSRRFRGSRPRFDRQTVVVLGVIGYTAITCAAFVADARYSVPVYPFLCLAAGSGLAAWLRRDRMHTTEAGSRAASSG